MQSTNDHCQSYQLFFLVKFSVFLEIRGLHLLVRIAWSGLNLSSKFLLVSGTWLFSIFITQQSVELRTRDAGIQVTGSGHYRMCCMCKLTCTERLRIGDILALAELPTVGTRKASLWRRAIKYLIWPGGQRILGQNQLFWIEPSITWEPQGELLYGELRMLGGNLGYILIC